MTGQSEIMLKARNRLLSFNGMSTLKRMMSYDANTRPSMLDVINSELFAPLVAPASAIDACDFKFMKLM
jgi:hypothetical protein